MDDWLESFEEDHADWREEDWYGDLVGEMEDWLGVDVGSMDELEREAFFDSIVDWLNDHDIDAEYWNDIFEFYYETAS